MHEIMCRRTFGDVQLRLRFELADIPEAGVTYVCMNGWLSVDPVPYVRTFRAAPCYKATWRRFKGDTGNYHEGGNELFVTRGIAPTKTYSTPKALHAGYRNLSALRKRVQKKSYQCSYQLITRNARRK